MALLWHKQDGDTRYEVRTAGNTVRLYSNGVFHSQYNPTQPITGSVWDLLLLPAFFAPQTVQRVLMLGVGGGTVIRQMSQLLQPGALVGVELNPVHVTIARRFFGVKGRNVTLHQADALRWVKEYRGERFDLIIDDLFGHVGGEARRVVAADGRWFRQLAKLLAPGGTLVFNFIDGAQLKECAWFHDPRIAARYPAAFRFSAPGYTNVIGAFLRSPVTTAQLRRNLAAHLELARTRQRRRLNYRIRRLSPR